MINNMALTDMAAIQRIRDRIVEDKAASERAALSQSENVGKPVSGSEEKNVFLKSSRIYHALKRYKMLMP